MVVKDEIAEADNLSTFYVNRLPIEAIGNYRDNYIPAHDITVQVSRKREKWVASIPVVYRLNAIREAERKRVGGGSKIQIAREWRTNRERSGNEVARRVGPGNSCEGFSRVGVGKVCVPLGHGLRHRQG